MKLSALSNYKKQIMVGGVICVTIFTGLFSAAWYYSSHHVDGTVLNESKSHYDRGVEYLSSKHYYLALQEFSAATEVNSGNTMAYLAVADIYVIKGKYDDAIALLESATDVSDSPSLVYEKLGSITYEQNGYEKADEYLTEAVDIDSSNASARILLAQAKINTQNFDEASDILEPIEDDSDRYHEARFLLAMVSRTDVAAASDYLDDAAQTRNSDLKDRVEAYKVNVEESKKFTDGDDANPKYVAGLIGYSLINEGQADLAISILEPVIEELDEYWEVYQYLTKAYFLKGDYAKAREMVDEALALNSIDYISLQISARLYVEGGDENQITKTYKAAITAAGDENSEPIRVEYAQVLEDLGLYSSALQQYDQLMSMKTEGWVEYKLRKAELTLQRLNQYDEAVDLCNELVEEYEDFEELGSGSKSRIYDCIGWGIAQSGSRSKGLNWVEVALEEDESSAAAHYHYAAILFESGEYEGVREHLERAIDLDLVGDISGEAQKLLDRL